MCDIFVYVHCYHGPRVDNDAWIFKFIFSEKKKKFTACKCDEDERNGNNKKNGSSFAY